jgi:hypothetical protein
MTVPSGAIVTPSNEWDVGTSSFRRSGASNVVPPSSERESWRSDAKRPPASLAIAGDRRIGEVHFVARCRVCDLEALRLRQRGGGKKQQRGGDDEAAHHFHRHATPP